MIWTLTSSCCIPATTLTKCSLCFEHSHTTSRPPSSWHESRKTLVRMFPSVRHPIPILPATLDQISRHSLRMLPPLDKDITYIAHSNIRPPNYLNKETLSCSARYWGLATFYPTCTAYSLSSHFNYSMTQQYKGQEGLG
ncbi:hypothetical protein Fcan01_17188 [Folsomia candida]|uniref:Uncharacterized protein n=1 Tax=Folsomia candida TaxID=158441 RepID=A0A226DTI9_FOLCA|nr:hypothetical protein Fcan01_17188 [Folsomia candida]